MIDKSLQKKSFSSYNNVQLFSALVYFVVIIIDSIDNVQNVIVFIFQSPMCHIISAPS